MSELNNVRDLAVRTDLALLAIAALHHIARRDVADPPREPLRLVKGGAE